MNPQEQELAEQVYQSIQNWSRNTARSQQSAEFRFGVSDLGWCSEKARRMLDRQVPEREDTLQAFIGSWVGEGVEQAFGFEHPEALIQQEVEITLKGETRDYALMGHPDILLPGLVLDVKTVDGLERVKRSGPSLSQQFQRHCYAQGAHAAGMLGDVPLEDVQVANVWIDRSGATWETHVQMEKFDPSIVQQAGDWLDEVVYNFIHKTEARKEPPRTVCERYCGFFRVCRAFDTDVEGRIDDPEQVAAVDLYTEGMELVRQGERMKKQAKQGLVGVRGNTEKFQVRWTWVNETTIQAGTRSGFEKLEVRKLK